MCGMYSFVLCWFSRVSFLHCLLESPGRDGWLGNEFERLSVTPCGDFLLLCESKQMDSISWRDGWARGNVCVKPRKHPLIRKMFFTVWLRSCQSTPLNQNTLPYSHTHTSMFICSKRNFPLNVSSMQVMAASWSAEGACNWGFLSPFFYGKMKRLYFVRGLHWAGYYWELNCQHIKRQIVIE